MKDSYGSVSDRCPSIPLLYSRTCDLTKLRVRDVALGEHVSPRTIVMQQKTQRPVQFEITEQTRAALESWMRQSTASQRKLSVSEAVA